MHRKKRQSAFTLIELLTVMVIILLLAGLVLGLVGHVTTKASRAKAESHIAAFSSALESYKSDNGTYPRNTDTDSLDPQKDLDITVAGGKYQKASGYLYQCLTGDVSGKKTVGTTYGKTYFDVLPADLAVPGSTYNFYYVIDGWGNPFGYSTANAAAAEAATASPSPSPNASPSGYNPTFDLWSTGGYTGAGKAYPSDLQDKTSVWVKNW